MFTAVCPVPRLHLEFLLCPVNLSLGEDALTAQAVAPNPLHCNGPLPCDSPRGHVSLPLLIFFFFFLKNSSTGIFQVSIMSSALGTQLPCAQRAHNLWTREMVNTDIKNKTTK